MSALAGFVPLRAHQFSRQPVFGTPVAATRRYPFTGVPSRNRNWTDPEGDFGSYDPVAPPFLGVPDFTAPITIPVLNYNDLPLLLAGFFGGAVSPSASGTGFVWHWTPSSTTPDPVDVFTHEFGDDVLTFWDQLGDGMINDLTIDSPESGAGQLTATAAWKYGSWRNTTSTDNAVIGTVPTPGLAVDITAIPVYLQDAKVYINSDPSDIGGYQIMDAVHKFTLHLSKETDEKRFVNGTQNTDLQAWGPGKRVMELTIVGAKTPDMVGTGSEADAWSSNASVPRYAQVAFESTEEASAGVPYSWLYNMPMRYYTLEDGEVGQNTTVVLNAHAFLDDTLGYAFDTEVVNTLSEAELGEVS